MEVGSGGPDAIGSPLGLHLGTQPWLDAYREAINASESYARAGQGWRWPLGLGFLGDTSAATRFAVLDLHDGSCRSAQVVDEVAFEAAPFKISASYSRWEQVMEGVLEPMRALLLKRLDCGGDTLTVIRFLPAAKAMLEAARSVDTTIPAEQV